MRLKRKIENLRVLFRYGFRPQKPVLMLRVAKSYTQALLGGPPPLHYVDFVTDYTCNLRCAHCFATSLKDPKKKKMTFRDYRRVAKEAMALGVIQFSFQGGEVLLDKRLPAIIKAFKLRQNYIGVTTNGFLLTEDRILALKKLGVDKLSISFDSGLAKEHDRFRGVPGGFERAWKGMELALKNGLRVTINTTITHQNLRSEGIKKLLAWADQNKVILNPIFACPAGRWQDNLKILVNAQDRQYLDRLKEKSSWIRRDMDSNWFRFGCGAVKEVLYVTPYGEVMPCPFLHFSLGNLKKEPLKKIRARGLEYQIFQEYHSLCLAAEDKFFMRKYLRAIKGRKLPVKVELIKEILKD